MSRSDSLKATTKGHSSEFFDQISSFNRCRQAMDKKWHLNSQGKVELIKSIDNLTNSDGKIDGNLRQQSVNGDPVKTAQELFEAATTAKDEFRAFVMRIVRATEIPPNYVSIANLKSMERSIEKARDDYGKRDPGPDVSWLFDIVRGMIICEAETEIVALMEAVEALVQKVNDCCHYVPNAPLSVIPIYLTLLSPTSSVFSCFPHKYLLLSVCLLDPHTHLSPHLSMSGVGYTHFYD